MGILNHGFYTNASRLPPLFTDTSIETHPRTQTTTAQIHTLHSHLPQSPPTEEQRTRSMVIFFLQKNESKW